MTLLYGDMMFFYRWESNIVPELYQIFVDKHNLITEKHQILLNLILACWFFSQIKWINRWQVNLFSDKFIFIGELVENHQILLPFNRWKVIYSPTYILITEKYEFINEKYELLGDKYICRREVPIWSFPRLWKFPYQFTQWLKRWVRRHFSTSHREDSATKNS